MACCGEKASGKGTSQSPLSRALQLIAGGQNVFNLVADVMNAAIGVAFQKLGDRGVVAQGFEKLDLGVGQFDEHHRDAVLGLLGRFGDLGAQRVAIGRDRCVQIAHGDGHVIETSDHDCLASCSTSCRQIPVRDPSLRSRRLEVPHISTLAQAVRTFTTFGTVSSVRSSTALALRLHHGD